MKKLFTLLTLVCITACSDQPLIEDSYLDSDLTMAASICLSEDYLISYANPNPTELESVKPVFIACHGYSATTFEWDEFKEWSEETDSYYISQVLLGGHGSNYEDFRASSWRDWQMSIIEEYERLVIAGYTNINFVASSTSCTLILELLATDFFNNRLAPKNIMLIDPMVIPSDKTLPLIGIIGPMLGYIDSGNTTDEDEYWYHFRPQETLQELYAISKIARKALEDGIKLPSDCSLKVYKSIQDPTTDPVGAVLIYNGIKTAQNSPIDVEMIDSDLHVYTRLNLRATISEKDISNQLNTFTDFIERTN